MTALVAIPVVMLIVVPAFFLAWVGAFVVVILVDFAAVHRPGIREFGATFETCVVAAVCCVCVCVCVCVLLSYIRFLFSSLLSPFDPSCVASIPLLFPLPLSSLPLSLYTRVAYPLPPLFFALNRSSPTGSSVSRFS